MVHIWNVFSQHSHETFIYYIQNISLQFQRCASEVYYDSMAHLWNWSHSNWFLYLMDIWSFIINKHSRHDRISNGPSYACSGRGGYISWHICTSLHNICALKKDTHGLFDASSKLFLFKRSSLSFTFPVLVTLRRLVVFNRHRRAIGHQRMTGVWDGCFLHMTWGQHFPLRNNWGWECWVSVWFHSCFHKDPTI